MATLAGNTIASTYPLLLKIDSSGVDGTLRYVEDGDATDSTLKIATDAISIDATDKLYLDAGSNTYIHEVSADKMDFVVGAQTILELSEGGGGASDSMSIQALNKFYLDGGGTTYIQESADGVMTFVCDARTMLTLTQGSAGTGEVCVNEGSNSDVDFRVESNGEDEAILVDATNNHLYVNKGETAFTTSIHSVDDVAISVTATEAVINDDGSNTVDFRVESNGEDQAIFLDSNVNTLYINKGETAFATHIHSTNDVAMSVGSAGVIFNDDGHATNDFRIESDNNAHMFYVNSGTDRISMGTAGASPSAVLHVEDEDTEPLVIFESTDDDVDSGDIILQLDFSDDTNIHGVTARFISMHDEGGEIGYITTASDGVVNAITASDVRLKKDIVDTSINGLEIINALKIRDYTWDTPAGEARNGLQVKAQYVADEVYEVYPLATTGKPGAMRDVKDDDGNKIGEEIDPMGVADVRLISVLIKTAQELSAKVTALESKVTALEAA